MVETETPREVLTGGRVKGFLATARVQWLVAYYGDRVLARVLDSLPSNVADDVTLAELSGWCSFGSVLALDAAIIEVCGRRARELLRDLGRYAAHTSVGRSAGRDSLHRFFRSAALRDALFQESARGAYEELGPTHGRLSILSSPCFSASWCESVAGYLDQVVAIHDAFQHDVAVSSCRAAGDEACSFDIRWQ